TLTVAFCGVPDLYVNKKTSLITTLAPLVVFTVVLLPFVILVKSPLTYALISFLFAMHISGCIGDMYVALLLIFKFDKNTIVNDTGPKQTFYIPKNENE
ncbi:MAG: DUF3267 domain-containing protein, partial [Bacilli bacterium]|nr:DUF3267 domain-containing protein [Bacilli bacterium]